MKVRIKDFDSYLATQPVKARAALRKLRQTIKKSEPNAEELISYGMPAFRYHGMLVWFAAFKDHYSLFARPRVLHVFDNEIEPYEPTKSSIHFSYNKPLPVRLITKIVRLAVITNLQKAQIIPKRKT